MGKIALQIKATMSNADALYPQSYDLFNWTLKFKCTNCNESNPSWHMVSKAELIEITHSQVNFTCKCKCCKYENHLTILEDAQVNPKQKGSNSAGVVCKQYTNESEDQFKTIVVFDCRGLEPIEFEPRSGWEVKSGRKLFSDIEFDNNEWFDYNDVDDMPVEITNFSYQFIAIK